MLQEDFTRIGKQEQHITILNVWGLTLILTRILIPTRIQER